MWAHSIVPILPSRNYTLAIAVKRRKSRSKNFLVMPSFTGFLHFVQNILSGIVAKNVSWFKVNNRNTRKRCEICSKLTITTREHCSGVFIVTFEHISHLSSSFYCWLCASNCWLGSANNSITNISHFYTCFLLAFIFFFIDIVMFSQCLLFIIRHQIHIFIGEVFSMWLNNFRQLISFNIPWKHQKTRDFDVFRGNRKSPVALNELMSATFNPFMTEADSI